MVGVVVIPDTDEAQQRRSIVNEQLKRANACRYILLLCTTEFHLAGA